MIAYLRQEGLRLALFVDDFFLMSRPHLMGTQKGHLIRVLQQLGLEINFQKSSLTPLTKCQFIGFNVISMGSNGPWLQVTHRKLHKLRQHI